MLIDWYTIGAQVINFLVLVYLLRRFLYAPVVAAMESRQAEIAKRMTETALAYEAAEEEAETYRHMYEELTAQRKALLVRAEQEADIRRRALISEARVEIQEMQARWQQALRQEQESFLQDLRRRTGEQLYAIARRALTDLADVDLEHQMVQGFLRRCVALHPQARGELVESLHWNGTPAPLHIRSAFALAAPLQREILDTLREVLNDGTIEVDYEIAPDLIAGIELLAPAHKVAWHLEQYLNTLETTLIQFLEAEAYAKGQHEPGTD